MTELRVYRCHECGNVGYDRVVDRSTDSHCSLCSTTISDEPRMVYVSTVEEARRKAAMLAIEAQAAVSKVVMGVGLRRQVLDVVQSLVSMNRGWPVSLDQVLTECADADIPRERAMHFLDVLQKEELITHDHESVMLVV